MLASLIAVAVALVVGFVCGYLVRRKNPVDPKVVITK